MARPEFCPALSSLEIHDEETGEVKPPKKVKCKGTACPLFRKKSQSCALDEVATASPATDVVATPQPVLDEMALVRRLDESISGTFHQMSALVADVTGLPMRFTGATLGLLLALTLTMCPVAGVVAARNVLLLDPADLF